VKTVMKENIQQILLNDEKLNVIDASAAQLNQQSEAFKTNTKALTNKM
jgi:Fe-S cluster biosynthesis and repair protein YggX